MNSRYKKEKTGAVVGGWVEGRRRKIEKLKTKNQIFASLAS
jgi:hypothetical protein